MRENPGPERVRQRGGSHDDDKKAWTTEDCFLVGERRGVQFGRAGDAQDSAYFHHARYCFHE